MLKESFLKQQQKWSHSKSIWIRSNLIIDWGSDQTYYNIVLVIQVEISLHTEIFQINNAYLFQLHAHSER